MTTRREFLVGAGAGLATLGTAGLARAQDQEGRIPLGLIDKVIGPGDHPQQGPLVVSTWNHGMAANAAAWNVLGEGGRAVDAVEQGVRVTEADPEVRSVGYGGMPDREGHVTLDSCIMDERGNAGSVAFLQDIMHPVSVARKVMDDTPHVMLVGEGARRFAVANGFPEQDLLTDEARRTWQEWLKTSEYHPWSKESNPALQPSHDTISMLAIDTRGNLSGSCTTSGMAFKMHGRVGDSPIIGASLFVDNEVGAACATGVGEEVMKTVGSFLIVELMRQGMSPDAACREAVERIVQKNPDWRNIQVGYLALDRAGNVGSYAIQPNFQYALRNGDRTELTNVADRAAADH